MLKPQNFILFILKRLQISALFASNLNYLHILYYCKSAGWAAGDVYHATRNVVRECACGT